MQKSPRDTRCGVLGSTYSADHRIPLSVSLAPLSEGAR
jgi:hypothetical protein